MGRLLYVARQESYTRLGYVRKIDNIDIGTSK